MRCRKALWFLSARCDGTLSERQRGRLESHLSGCPDCRREAFYFSEIAAMSGRLQKTTAVRPDFNLRLRAAIRREEPLPRRWSLRPPNHAILAYRPALVAVTACVVCLVGLGAYKFVFVSGSSAVKTTIVPSIPQATAHSASGELELALRSGLIPVDGMTPEMKRLQDQYLATGQLPRDYVVDAVGADDSVGSKPMPSYVMPTMSSEQVVRKVSY